jgi:hypothetical protein
MDWSSSFQATLLLVAALLAYLQLRNYNDIERFRNTQALVEEWYRDCSKLFISLRLGEPHDYDRRRSEIAVQSTKGDTVLTEQARRLFAFVATAQHLMQRHLIDEETFLFSLAGRMFAVCYVLAPVVAQLPNARRRYDFSWLSGRAYRYMLDHVLEKELTLGALRAHDKGAAA